MSFGGWRAVRDWARRYLPAEVAGLLTAAAGALIAHRMHGSAATTAIVASNAEAIGYYGLIGLSDLRSHRRAGRRPLWATLRTLRDLVVEFGPAEIVDTVLVRPAFMYAGPIVTGHLISGTVAGKIAADLVFYAIAISGYELRTRLFREPARRQISAPRQRLALDGRRVPSTPYLEMDLDAVERAYRTLTGVLPGVTMHYAVKCNPDPRVLRHLAGLGCRFEIASAPELDMLLELGVDPRDVLFSNPVKTPGHVRAAFASGIFRYAVDSLAELDKLAAHAPGAAVYVRLSTGPAASQVPSEGKFGVDVATAEHLLRTAVARGLVPYGVTFHVGSQTVDPTAWGEAIERCATLMRNLLGHGIRLTMLDLGGGFPAGYVGFTPQPKDYAKHILAALERCLPYPMELVAEPGRALVAEAGTMVATVIGVAERHGRTWVHLDVGAFNGLMEALETGNRLHYPVSDSRASTTLVPCHVTGPTCDSQDTVLHDALLSADIAVGDTVRIHSAGAYTTSYASRFNGFDLPSTVTL